MYICLFGYTKSSLQNVGSLVAEHKDGADSAIHDGHVMKGFTDGHVSVIGHGCQEKKLCGPKKSNEKYLTSTGVVSNGIVPT